MTNHKSNVKRRNQKAWRYMILVINIALIIEIAILNTVNKRNANNTCELFLDQVSTILTANSEDEAEMIEALKEEYIVKAQGVSYMLSLYDDAKYDIKELQKIAELMAIDEIHLFDKDGIMFAGTVPGYYGLTFDDGDQVSFFKPMLNDKTLSMCQDVTPNTAEAKSMMYAIVWNETGEYMVQVGIEPVRLLNELKKNEISEVINDMPVSDGLDIYISDINDDTIISSTNENVIGTTLVKAGLHKEIEQGVTDVYRTTIGGYRHFCWARQVDNYYVTVSYSTRINVVSFIVAIVIEYFYLLVAGAVVLYMVKKLIAANDKSNEQLSVLMSMSEIYYSMHLIDLIDDSVIEYSAHGVVKEFNEKGDNASALMKEIIERTIKKEWLESALAFTDLESLSERMTGKKMITAEFDGMHIGWIEASFIAIETDENQKPEKVIFVTRDIDQDKKKEEKLIYSSNTDELTGLLNRHAYEEAVAEFNDKVIESNFVYISLDVNGLKIVNDTLGHSAGDELIVGAAECMKRCIGPYGKLYRTGGDEFAAIIYASENELEAIKKDFEDTTANWTGKEVESLTVSCGYVPKREVETVSSVREMAIIADKKMYEAKSIFYRSKGVDRRGQKEAHTALCTLYTKILKINITNDTYQIINMDENEQTEEKGFADSISAWLLGFGNSGQVHEDDLEEYLSQTSLEYMRGYFKRDKTSLCIFYRRKYGEKYKKVMMEIIPSSDYSNDNQNLFLYVKNIDK